MTTNKTAATTARPATAPTRMLLAALVLLPTVGLATWAWLAMVRVKEGLRPIQGFEGMHLED